MQLIVKLILHRNKTGLFLGPNGSEVPFATLVALFLFPTQEVTTAFVPVFSPDAGGDYCIRTCFFFFFLVYTIQMGNFDPIPTIFLKLAQSEVQGYPGRLSDLEENSSTSFPVSIFQK